ncbi:MAG: SRPBCC family protein [Patescibacteria group bacterium]
MSKKNLAVVTKVLDNDINKVWEGLTNPKIVKKYFFGTDLTSDFKVGSTIKFTGEYEGKQYVDGGVISKIDAPNLLEYSYYSSWSEKENIPENHLIVTYQLKEIGSGKTELTITQESYDEEKKLELEQNWSSIIDEMQKIL